jgi:hypothetical protein
MQVSVVLRCLLVGVLGACQLLMEQSFWQLTLLDWTLFSHVTSRQLLGTIWKKKV